MKWKKRLKELQALRAKHGRDRSLVRKFPDLSVEQRTPPTSDRMEPPPILTHEQLSAMLGPSFFIQHLHKSGYKVTLKESEK